MDFSQRLQVLKMLKKGKCVSSMQAFEDFGATRLSAIIFNLRAEGLNVQDRWVNGVNRYGNPCRYKEYFLKK